jgi:hypothetical protein
MKQKRFTHKSRNCFYEAKKIKPAFASLQQKMVRRKKDCSDMDLAGDLTGDVGAIFCTIEAS